MNIDLENRQTKADQAQPYLMAWVIEFRKAGPILERLRAANKVNALKKIVQRDPITNQGYQLYKELRPYFEKDENLD